jgi:hypothetical protein
MDPPDKDGEHQGRSIVSSTVANIGPSSTSWGSCTPLIPSKEMKSVKGYLVPLKVGDLSKQNPQETTSSADQSEPPAQSEIKAAPAILFTTSETTKDFGGRNRVQRFPPGLCDSKASVSHLSTRLKHRALACHKVIKPGPRIYRGARKFTGEICKAQLQFLENHVKDHNDLFIDGEALLHSVAAAYPKYNQVIRALPMLVNLVPEELKERLMAKENVQFLKIGALLLKRWTSRSI